MPGKITINKILASNESINNLNKVQTKNIKNYFSLCKNRKDRLKKQIIDHMFSNSELNQALRNRGLKFNVLEIIKIDENEEDKSFKLNFIEKSKSEIEKDKKETVMRVQMAKDMSFFSWW